MVLYEPAADRADQLDDLSSNTQAEHHRPSDSGPGWPRDSHGSPSKTPPRTFLEGNRVRATHADPAPRPRAGTVFSESTRKSGRNTLVQDNTLSGRPTWCS